MCFQTLAFSAQRERREERITGVGTTLIISAVFPKSAGIGDGIIAEKAEITLLILVGEQSNKPSWKYLHRNIL